MCRTFSFAFRLVSEHANYLMDRRTFLASSGAAAFGTLVPRISRSFLASNTSEPFAWETNDLIFSFEVTAGKLRQKRVVPAGMLAAGA